MAVTTDNYQPEKYLGNGITTEFSFDWKLFDENYSVVLLEDVTTGVQTEQVLGSDYTVTFDDTGGIVTFFTAPTNQNYVIIARDVAKTQESRYTTSDGFQGNKHEDSFDKVTIITQDLQENSDRHLTYPLGTNTSIIDNTIPVPSVANAGKALVSNENGDGYEFSETNVNDIDEAVDEAAASAAAAAVSASNAATSASNSATSASESAVSADESESSAADAAASAASIITGAELGSVIPFYVETLPQGYLECNGAVINRITYPELVAYLTGDEVTPTATLPDLRGEFIRGWDNGRGIDTGRLLSSSQLDSLKEHEHFTVNSVGSTAGLSASNYLSQNSNNALANNDYNLRGTSGEANIGLTSSTGDTETRPRNVAFKFGMKAFSTTDNSGSIDLEGLEQDVINNTAAIASNTTDIALNTEKGEETVLFVGNAGVSTITLNDDINNYKSLEITATDSTGAININIITVGTFKTTTSSRALRFTASSSTTNRILLCYYATDTSITINNATSMTVTEVKGIK